ncbi:hypothetical protein [Streptomyces sp. NPDC051561]|uniref:hypothetical protein n=1 Tax=Streptomyces sp. NPDC051561 TaxID=3365658 RepID=UPI0037A4740E
MSEIKYQDIPEFLEKLTALSLEYGLIIEPAIWEPDDEWATVEVSHIDDSSQGATDLEWRAGDNMRYEVWNG